MLAVWNYRIAISPEIIVGFEKLILSIPFFKSIKMTSERT